MDNISASEIGRLLRGRMGLIIGPGASLYAGFLNDLVTEINEQFSCEWWPTLWDTVDAAIAAGAQESALKNAIRAFMNRQSGSALMSHLAGIRWAAVFSACLDGVFDEALRLAMERTISGQQVTVLTDLTIDLPPRTLPLFKLLGNVPKGDFAFSGSTYVHFRGTWRNVTTLFANRVRSNPVLCIGMSECPNVLHDLIGELTASRSTTPSQLLLMAGDPLCNDTKLQGLIAGRLKLITVNGTLSDLTAAANATPTGAFASAPQRALTTTESDRSLISRYCDLFTLVNDHLQSDIRPQEQTRLQDILFSPSVPRWDAYAHRLDFKRTATETLLQKLFYLCRTKDLHGAAAVLIGPAASGKTTILKRVAFELASQDFVTLWLRPWFYQDPNKALHEFLPAIGRLRKSPEQPVIAIMDDPPSFGDLSPRLLATAAGHFGIDLILLIGVRSTDWATLDRSDMVGGLGIQAEATLSDDLDDAEWRHLPQYLQQLGIAADMKAALASIENIQRGTKNTLGTLYYLLPQTRAQITGSIRNEYFRLGDLAGLSNVIIGATTESSELLRRAYEMIAVSDNFSAPLPTEVLVKALGIGFDDFFNAFAPGSLCWGLFYADESGSGNTVVYRTRNAVVSRTIVETLNGGTLGRSGELRVLRTLLSACTGSDPVYRHFCLSVLVPYTKLRNLEYTEGMNLYDAALQALPRPDKTILHHKALWIKNKGKDPMLAARIADEALRAPHYPYADRGESNEHIHNTIAAIALDALELRRLDLPTGKQVILEHLEKASPPGFFNANAVHVNAGLMLSLVEKMGPDEQADATNLLSNALLKLERTLQLLESPIEPKRSTTDTIAMLELMKSKVLERAGTPTDLESLASRLWQEHASEEGFVLACRKFYADACRTNKGTDFNNAFQYFQKCLSEVQAEHRPSISLQEIGMTIYYRWRVQRAHHHYDRNATDLIDWEFLKDTSALSSASANVGDRPYSHYIHALALAHLGKWGEANGVLGQLRASGLRKEFLWTPRDFLLEKAGGVRIVQGLVKRASERLTLFVEELDTDFFVSRMGNWAVDQIEHAAIQFTLAGVTAVPPTSPSTHL